MKKTSKSLQRKRIPNKGYPTDKQIRDGFKRLFLGQLNATDYTSANEFSHNFKRCTLFEETEITTTAHAGV